MKYGLYACENTFHFDYQTADYFKIKGFAEAQFTSDSMLDICLKFVEWVNEGKYYDTHHFFIIDEVKQLILSRKQ